MPPIHPNFIFLILFIILLCIAIFIKNILFKIFKSIKKHIDKHKRKRLYKKFLKSKGTDHTNEYVESIWKELQKNNLYLFSRQRSFWLTSGLCPSKDAA